MPVFLIAPWTHLGLSTALPEWATAPVLGVPPWHWAMLAAVAAASVGLGALLGLLVRRLLRPLAQRVAGTSADRALSRIRTPLWLLLTLESFALGVEAVGVPVRTVRLVSLGQDVLVTVTVAWLAARVVDVAAAAIEDRLVRRGQTMARSVMPLLRRTLQVVVALLAALAILDAGGVNVTSVLAGLGIGGVAIALAAQKTVENLFGGLTLIGDQPVRVGDFCRFGDRVGTIEEIGLRSTRIRTLDRTVVTVPNATFASMSLENYAHRDRIWFSTTLGLRYETTPDQLRHVLIELKKLLVAHPRVHPDPARVRFVSFGAYSLDVEVFAYVTTADINEYLAVQEDLLLRIMDVVAASGTGFAFPSQTIYASSDTGLDAARGRAAEAVVADWRSAGRLGLPTLAPAEARELADSLDYPPRGSAAGG